MTSCRIFCYMSKDLISSRKLGSSIINNYIRFASTNTNGYLNDRKEFLNIQNNKAFNTNSLHLSDFPMKSISQHRFYSDKATTTTIDKKAEKTAPLKPITNAEKLKKAVKEYGSTVIVFHISISLISLGLCYVLISSGVDLTETLRYFGMSDEKIGKLAGNAGTFVVAYAVHKVFTPVRMGITLTATPFIVRYLRNIGWIKK